MESYAVIQTGGKQYRVTCGQVIEVERLNAEAGQEVAIAEVVALNDGSTLKVGTPFVEGAQVTLAVVGQKRGPKLINFKKRRRTGYARRVGHRQDLTVVKVKAIA